MQGLNRLLLLLVALGFLGTTIACKSLKTGLVIPDENSDCSAIDESLMSVQIEEAEAAEELRHVFHREHASGLMPPGHASGQQCQVLSTFRHLPLCIEGIPEKDSKTVPHNDTLSCKIETCDSKLGSTHGSGNQATNIRKMISLVAGAFSFRHQSPIEVKEFAGQFRTHLDHALRPLLSSVSSSARSTFRLFSRCLVPCLDDGGSFCPSGECSQMLSMFRELYMVLGLCTLLSLSFLSLCLKFRSTSSRKPACRYNTEEINVHDELKPLSLEIAKAIAPVADDLITASCTLSRSQLGELFYAPVKTSAASLLTEASQIPGLSEDESSDESELLDPSPTAPLADFFDDVDVSELVSRLAGLRLDDQDVCASESDEKNKRLFTDLKEVTRLHSLFGAVDDGASDDETALVTRLNGKDDRTTKYEAAKLGILVDTFHCAALGTALPRDFVAAPIIVGAAIVRPAPVSGVAPFSIAVTRTASAPVSGSALGAAAALDTAFSSNTLADSTGPSAVSAPADAGVPSVRATGAVTAASGTSSITSAETEAPSASRRRLVVDKAFASRVIRAYAGRRR